MRTLFLNVACILTLFDIGAPVNEKLEASYNEEHLLRYVMISPYLFFLLFLRSWFHGTLSVSETCD